MNIEAIKEALPEYAKDVRLNLSSVLNVDPASGLTEQQILGTALCCAYALKNPLIMHTFSELAKQKFEVKYIDAIKAAAILMGMNNVYYRYTHSISNEQIQNLPAKLRMNVMMNHGIEKTDFELFSLAVSAINGCGMCMDAHTNALIKAGLSKEGIQHGVRIAGVIAALVQAVEIDPELYR